MHFAAALLLSAHLFAADASLPLGTQLVYRGSMVPVKDDGIPAKKEFGLALVVSEPVGDPPAAGSQTLLWTLAETGRGSGGGADRQALDGGDDRGGYPGLCGGLSAANRHASERGIPAACSAKPAAAFPS